MFLVTVEQCYKKSKEGEEGEEDEDGGVEAEMEDDVLSSDDEGKKADVSSEGEEEQEELVEKKAEHSGEDADLSDSD